MDDIRARFKEFNESPKRFRYEKYFWLLMLLVAILTGLINSVALVSALSFYALVITANGAEQAAEARKAAGEGGDTVEDIRDDLVAHTTLEKVDDIHEEHHRADGQGIE